MSRIDTHISNSQITARDSALQWRPLEAQFEAERKLLGAMQRPDINKWWANLTDMQRFGYTAIAFGGSVGIVCGLVALSNSNVTDHNASHHSNSPDLGGQGQSIITPETVGAVLKATVLLLSTGGDVSHIKILPMSEAGKSVDNKVFCLPPNGHSLVENTCVKSEISLVVDSQNPQKLSEQIKSAWPVVESVLPASAEGDKGTTVSVIITKDGSQFLLTTSPIKTKDGKSYFLAKAWATPIDQDPSWEAGAVADGNHDLWLQIPLFQAKFDADLAQRRLSVPPGLKEQVLRFPVKGKINGIWIFDSKRTAQIVSSNGNKREQIAGMAPFTDLAFSLGRVRLAGDGANVAPATPTTPPTEAPTPVPATEVPARSVFDNAPFLDLGTRYKDRLPGPIQYDNYIPGMTGNYLSIAYLQLLNFEQVEDDQTPFKLIFGFGVNDKDYAVRVEYNPCNGKNVKLYHGISGKLKVGDIYRIGLYGGTVTDRIAVSQALGDENSCTALLNLKPLTEEVSGLFIGLQPDKAGNIVDLTGETYVGAIDILPKTAP